MGLRQMRVLHRRLLRVRRLLRDPQPDHRRVRLAQQRDPHRARDRRQPADDDEDVLVADGLGDVPACDGTEGGAEEGAQGVDGHGVRAVAVGEEVGDGPAANGYGCAACESSCRDVV